MIRDFFPPDRTVESILSKTILPTEECFRPSAFLFPFLYGEECCLYHTLTKRCLGVEKELFTRIREQSSFTRAELAASSELSRLRETVFLVPESLNETQCYHDLIRLLRLRSLRKHLNSYTILTTTACNARCFYCVEEGTPVVTMDEETTRQLAEFILRSRDPDRPVKLTWFGGEPLAAPQVIDRISAALTEAGISFTAQMVTNGVLIDDEILEKMTGPWRIRYLQLSIDGEEQEYNRRKNYLRPYPSAYRVMKDVLLRLSRTGIRVALRCNVDGENADGLERMVDDLAETVQDKARIGLYFSVLIAQQNSQDHARLFQRCMEAKLYAREKGFIYAPFTVPHRLRSMLCGAENPTGSAVVFPDGRLYNCYCFLPEMQTGDIWNGLDRQDYIKSFLLPDPVREECRDCTFLPICTSFSRCPTKKQQCREVRGIEVLNDLRCEMDRCLSRGGETPSPEIEQDLIC